MRIALITLSVLAAACVRKDEPNRVVVKKVFVPGPERIVTKIVEKKVYVTTCPPVGYCNGIADKPTCDAELRCQWAQGAVVGAYCREIYCKGPRDAASH
jgi:hypothetical protein